MAAEGDGNNGDVPHQSPIDAATAARKLWLNATDQSDLDEVERLYRWALSSKGDVKDTSNDDIGDVDDNEGDPPPKKKKKKRKSGGDCGLNPTQFARAGEKLALLLCQSGRCHKTKRGLASMGFACRLAKDVLDYPFEGDVDAAAAIGGSNDATTNTKNDGKASKKSLCQIIDGFLSQSELERLRTVFESPTSSYWTDHDYAVEPPSPYFSYVIPLEDIGTKAECSEGMGRYGFIGHLVGKVMSCPLLNEKFPKLGNASFVELWAHNRPHASGHQMHFDSDDEGRGGIRNPIISTILYITSTDATVNEIQTGGPSLVTNQKLTDVRLATKGYLAHPKPQRLVAFDGRYLHGVVPGKGYRGGRRVTLMMAFWEDIQVRDGDGPGSARPFPSNDSLPEWASALVAPLDGGNDTSDYESCIERDPIKLDVIYESLDGKPWKRGMGMPSYDQVFQGF